MSGRAADPVVRGGLKSGRRKRSSGARVIEPLCGQGLAEDPDRLGTDAVDGEKFLLRVARHLPQGGDTVMREFSGGGLADRARKVADGTYVWRGGHVPSFILGEAITKDGSGNLNPSTSRAGSAVEGDSVRRFGNALVCVVQVCKSRHVQTPQIAMGAARNLRRVRWAG